MQHWAEMAGKSGNHKYGAVGWNFFFKHNLNWRIWWEHCWLKCFYRVHIQNEAVSGKDNILHRISL